MKTPSNEQNLKETGKQPDVLIYDTTLRDGTQGEGISFSVAGKLKLAEQMDVFGIDYIEGGWPGSNPRDMAFFEEARKLNLKHARVTAFGSTRRANLKVEEDPQIKLLLDAETPVITIFGKTWLLHVTEVLRTTPDKNLQMIEDSVRYLASMGRELIYDAEHFFDGYKDNSEYALQTLEAALNGGAVNVSLCDTNGGTMVQEFDEIVRAVKQRFPTASIGVHCHNDCGLGVALSQAGVDAGANLVQGTLNGYGERIGNADLTAVMPNLHFKMNRVLSCSPMMHKLQRLSEYAAEMANLEPNRKEPYVGDSAFAHKGGVHANAAAKVARSYEHIQPEKVGNRQRILISDMSGRSSIVMKAREMGIDLEEKSQEMKNLISQLKKLESRGFEFENADVSFKMLLLRYFGKQKNYFNLVHYRVITEVDRVTKKIISEATVKLKVNEQVHHTVAETHGPVGALDHALRRALENDYPCIRDVILKDYKVRILDPDKGADATVQVLIQSSDGEDFWWTTGAGDNIIEASWHALRDSIQYKLSKEEDGSLVAQGG